MRSRHVSSMASESQIYARSIREMNAIRTTAILMWIVGLLVLALRFASRRISKAGFWWDDWLLVPAVVRLETLSLEYFSCPND